MKILGNMASVTQISMVGFSLSRHSQPAASLKQLSAILERKKKEREREKESNTFHRDNREISATSNFKKMTIGVPTVVQQVKVLALLQLWHRLQLWLGFSPWPKNFHRPWVQPKEKKRERERAR